MLNVPLVALVLATVATPCSVQALPLPQNGAQVLKRADDQSSGGSVSPQVWIPILVIAVVFVLLAAIFYTRKKSWSPTFLSGLSNIGVGAGVVPPSGPEIRQVTAEQLVGGPPASNTTSNAATNNPPTTARRTRRPRRTPSQMSTTSLPEYMKEPGEQEVVIIRGLADMEDAQLPTTLDMHIEEEDLTLITTRTPGSHSHRGSVSQDDSYGLVPDTPHNQPLLHEDDEEDISQPPGEGMPIRNVASTSCENEPVNMEPTSDPDPRGPAPAYFEVAVADPAEDDTLVSAASAQSPTPNQSASDSGDRTDGAASAPARRSGFKNIFGGVFGNARSNYRSPYGHGRAGSNTSAASNGPSASRHRPSQSLGLSLSQSRSSNNSSTQHLTSPSMISLNSISPPLTHTAVRTEFTYPRTGPTPDQIKLISSRESFAMFGVPYGEDAVRFASQSRLGFNDNGDLPPDFDEPNGSRARTREGPETQLEHTRDTFSTSVIPEPDLSVGASPIPDTASTRHRRASSSSLLPAEPASEPHEAPTDPHVAPLLSGHSGTYSPHDSQHLQQLTRASSMGALVKSPPLSGLPTTNNPIVAFGSSSGPSGLPGVAPSDLQVRAMSRASSVRSTFSYATAAESFRTATAGSRSVTPGFGAMRVGEFGDRDPPYDSGKEASMNARLNSN